MMRCTRVQVVGILTRHEFTHRILHQITHDADDAHGVSKPEGRGNNLEGGRGEAAASASAAVGGASKGIMGLSLFKSKRQPVLSERLIDDSAGGDGLVPIRNPDEVEMEAIL